ncbi:hypothetical protein BC830DRAFT_947595 [Chytriomyces sp. MP71]|nr:hypothetical protein BC830DRAFT_947595 [Chytriomyces sp. MP71]
MHSHTIHSHRSAWTTAKPTTLPSHTESLTPYLLLRSIWCWLSLLVSTTLTYSHISVERAAVPLVIVVVKRFDGPYFSDPHSLQPPVCTSTSNIASVDGVVFVDISFASPSSPVVVLFILVLVLVSSPVTRSCRCFVVQCITRSLYCVACGGCCGGGGGGMLRSCRFGD